MFLFVTGCSCLEASTYDQRFNDNSFLQVITTSFNFLHVITISFKPHKIEVIYFLTNDYGAFPSF